MEWPVPIAQRLLIVRHHGLERLFPDAVFPDVLYGVFAQTKHLCHDPTAGDVFAPGPHSKPVQQFNGEVNAEVAYEYRQIDGAMGGDEHEGGRFPVPAVNLLAELSQVAGDGLTPEFKLILNHPDGGVVHAALQ